jgi:methyl-accepting chemotaxis protein
MEAVHESGATELRRRLLRRSGIAGGLIAILLLVLSATVGSGSVVTMGGLVVVGALCAAAFVLERFASYRLAAQLLVYGVSVTVAAILDLDARATVEFGVVGLGLLAVAAGLLLGPRPCRYLIGANLVNAAFLVGRDVVGADTVTLQVIGRGLSAMILFPGLLVLVVPYLEQAVGEVEQLAVRLRRAEGFADDLGGTTGQLESATIEISVKSRQQREGAQRQSSAVREVLEAMRSMSRSSQEIAGAAQTVASNADCALSNNVQVGERMTTLSTHIERMTEALQGISEIARKSELLALNASLEGTRAGEAGKGFSLVASELQRLAERVVTAVREIRTLTADVREASSVTTSSVSEATELARATAEAARHIRAISQLQQAATDQIAEAMSDIDEVTAHAAEASEQTWAASEQLGHVAYRLNKLVEGLFAGAAAPPVSPLPGSPEAHDEGGGEDRRHDGGDEDDQEPVP